MRGLAGTALHRGTIRLFKPGKYHSGPVFLLFDKHDVAVSWRVTIGFRWAASSSEDKHRAAADEHLILSHPASFCLSSSLSFFQRHILSDALFRRIMPFILAENNHDSDQHTITMVNLVLDDLCLEAGIVFKPCFKALVLKLHLD